jgi:acid phosphatase
MTAVAAVLLFLAAACRSSSGRPAATSGTAGTTSSAEPSSTGTSLTHGPAPPEHVVVVIEENHAASSIIGNALAPYLNSLARSGATFTQSYAITHPSEPNYLALFSGSTQGVTDDECPPPGSPYALPNLASSLHAVGRTFVGYSEDLPLAGSKVCSSGDYARKHNPWVDFSNVPASSNQPFNAFPSDYSSLPTVSFVVPNLQHDMHDGSIEQADTWARQHLDGYVRWAATHNSLLVVTWDEDDSGSDNHIATIIVGGKVHPGDYPVHIDHYSVLRTLETMYGAPPSGAAAQASTIIGWWQ